MFEGLSDEGLSRTSYLIACPRTRTAVIIDPMGEGVHVIHVSDSTASWRMLD